MNTPFNAPRDAGQHDLDAFARELDAIVAGGDRTSSDLGRFADGIQRGSGTIQRGDVSRHAYPLRSAERARIWEDVLTDGRAARRGPLPGRIELRKRQRERPVVRSSALRFVPETQPTVTFLLVIAVLIAIGASFNSMAPGRMGDLTPTALAQGQQGDASPDAVPTTVVDPLDEPFLAPISPADCTVEPRPLDEVGEFVRDPGPLTERAYLPATNADDTTAVAAAESARGWEACSFEGEPGQRRAYESPRLIFEDPANTYFGKTYEEVLAENLETYRTVSEVILDDDPNAYIIHAPDAFEGTPTPNELTRGAAYRWVSLPSDAVQLADGRIAMPQSGVYDSRYVWQTGDGVEYSATNITVLTQDATQDGRWVVDEQFPGCAGECGAYWNNWETIVTAAGLELLPASPVDIVQVDDGTVWPTGTPTVASAGLEPAPASPVDIVQVDDGTVWPVGTPTGPHPATPRTGSSTAALPTAADCTVEPLTVDEVMVIVADPTATDLTAVPPSSIMSTPVGAASESGEPAGPVDPAWIDGIAADHREWVACVLADSWFQVWALSTGTAIQSDVFARLYAPTTTESDARAILESLERDGIFAYLETPSIHYGFDEGIPLIDPDPAVSLQVEIGTVHVSTITYDAAGSALGRGSTYSYRLNETFDRWLFDGCVSDCPELPFQTAASADATDAGAAACPVEPLTASEIAAARDAGFALPERVYVPVAPADPAIAADVRASSDLLDLCGEATETNTNIAYALLTNRYWLEHPFGVASADQRARSQFVSGEFGEALVGERPSQEELNPIRLAWQTSDTRGLESEIVHLMDPNLALYRSLPDGRIAMYSGEFWLRREGSAPATTWGDAALDPVGSRDDAGIFGPDATPGTPIATPIGHIADRRVW